MKSLNRVTLLGRVGKDPVTSAVGSTKKSYFSMATSEVGKDAKEYTDWHNIVAWGAVTEVIDKYVKKGDALMIEGALRQRSYDKDGAKVYVTEVELRWIYLLGSSGPKEAHSDGQPEVASSGTTEDELPF